MPAPEERVQLRHPEQGKAAPRIERRKYEMLKRTILKVVPRKEPGLPFARLATAVSRHLSRAERAGLGSVPWYATVVKLDLEARGFLRRVPGAGPQRLIRLK
jgi:hypothetical protein